MFKTAKVKATHAELATRFLHYHAIEHLKAFLLAHGHTPRKLRSKKFGHKYDKLRDRATELDLFFMDEVIDLMAPQSYPRCL